MRVTLTINASHTSSCICLLAEVLLANKNKCQYCSQSTSGVSSLSEALPQDSYRLPLLSNATYDVLLFTGALMKSKRSSAGKVEKRLILINRALAFIPGRGIWLKCRDPRSLGIYRIHVTLYRLFLATNALLQKEPITCT